jgi:hypothetical protein
MAPIPKPKPTRLKAKLINNHPREANTISVSIGADVFIGLYCDALEPEKIGFNNPYTGNNATRMPITNEEIPIAECFRVPGGAKGEGVIFERSISISLYKWDFTNRFSL